MPYLFFLFFLFFSPLISFASDEIAVTLRNPLLINGVLKTNEGGLAIAPGFRMQAKEIAYTQKKGETLIEASGDLILEIQNFLFVGEALIYDFNKKEGWIKNGKTALPPWFFGGDVIHILPDGNYQIEKAFLTTSEKIQPEWQILANSVDLIEQDHLIAKNIQFKFSKFPVFWIPYLNVRLSSMQDHPIDYQVRVAGRQGPRIGMVYKIFSSNYFKSFLRFDYRMTRGPGGGLEGHYLSLNKDVSWDSINYLAKDSSLTNPKEKYRFRFQGLYKKKFTNKKTTLELSYDKLSDKYMATDYKDKGLELETAGKTQLLIRHKEPFWIGSFFSRVRINSFQTVKQELPTLEVRWKPYGIGNTNIFAETRISSSYLDYEYAKNVKNFNEYKSMRLFFKQSFLRKIPLPFATLTPELSCFTIFYSNSRQRSPKWVLQGMTGATLKTTFFADFKQIRHSISPYSSYHFYTYPKTEPNHHYIFDINDGLTKLQVARVGLFQQFLQKQNPLFPYRLLSFDLFTFAFKPSRSIHFVIPKIYSEWNWYPNPRFKAGLEMGFDFQNHTLDHCNIRLDWTVSNDLALACEYRERSAYAWRKSDPYNFFLEVFRSQTALEHSPLSDRRETFLAHLYYRFNSNLALEISSRQGWNRKYEPGFDEFEIDLHTTLRALWHMRISYQHKENDDRIAFYFSLGQKKPTQKQEFCDPRLLEF